MNFLSRTAVGQPIPEEPIWQGLARTSEPGALVKQPTPVAELVVEGEVFEVLVGFGLAHLRTPDGNVYGVTKGTPGIENFGALHEGQRLRCQVICKFNRVLSAQLIA